MVHGERNEIRVGDLARAGDVLCVEEVLVSNGNTTPEAVRSAVCFLETAEIR